MSNKKKNKKQVLLNSKVQMYKENLWIKERFFYYVL